MASTERPGFVQRMRRFVLRIGAMASKEWMHIGRDPSTLYFALLMPLVMLILFGYAVSFDVDRVRTVVVDQDMTAQSRELTSHLFAGGTFVHSTATARAPEEIETLFRRGEASVALVIPRGYSDNVLLGGPVRVQLLVDAADNSTATSVLSYTGRFVTAVNRAAVKDVMGATPDAIESRLRALYNPSLRSALFLIPGLLSMIQAMMAVLLTALTVAREWERGSMEQLFATPVGRLEIVVGKLLPYFGVAFVQLLLVLVASAFLFDVPVRGSLLLLCGLSILFLFSMLGQGLLISVVTQNQMVATQVAALSSMLPAMLLSGFIMPIENMPEILQILTNLIPSRYFVHALRGIMLRGVESSVIARDALALVIFGCVMLLGCIVRFRRTIV
jgi:ABC-2 type transport system permease protein